jgi:hypothetical protein
MDGKITFRRCLLYGFEAISMHNGWAMAGVGGTIVFTGLVILATVISQLHRLLEFFENLFDRSKGKKATAAVAPIPDSPVQKKPELAKGFLDDLDAVVKRYKLAPEPLGETFSLVELHRLAGEIDDPHPHLTISHLRQECFLIPQGDGLFSWRP